MKASPYSLLLTPYFIPTQQKNRPFGRLPLFLDILLSYSGLIFSNATARVPPLRSTIITKTTSNSPSKGLLGAMRVRIALRLR
jgi:hypothetical protein